MILIYDTHMTVLLRGLANECMTERFVYKFAPDASSSVD